VCGVLKFKARANAGQCELCEGTQGGLGDVVGEALAEARERVINSHSLLKDGEGWDRLGPLYVRYFLTELARGDALNEVLKRLVLTMNGLNGRIRMEVPERIVGEVGMGAKQEAVGMVHDPRLNIKYVDLEKAKTNNPQFRNDLRQAKSALEKATNSGDQDAIARANRDLLAVNFGLNPGVVKEGMNVMVRPHMGGFQLLGNINIQRSLFDKNSQDVSFGYSPIRTIIHEATHKFAGTIDYCYFKLDGSGPQDKMGAESGGAKKFGDKAYNKTGDALARMNADSFAWVCFRAGVQGFKF
jgi:hypothetical protein